MAVADGEALPADRGPFGGLADGHRLADGGDRRAARGHLATARQGPTEERAHGPDDEQ